jgi:hypothetical protein
LRSTTRSTRSTCSSTRCAASPRARSRFSASTFALRALKSWSPWLDWAPLSA